ncbi:MAG TPA: regulatory protein RecX, partial [Clostridia bacterium]|nr:regulatory protein RecX [Clostridia bacterium]
EYDPALKAAVAFLASRARTVQEICERLERSGYHEEAIRRVIERLEALRLIGDERFAQEWAASRSGRAVGKRRIAQELSRKGVEQGRIEAALDRLDPDQLAEQALALAKKLCAKHEKADKQERRRKVTQALIRRGFDWEQASKAYQDAEDSKSF